MFVLKLTSIPSPSPFLIGPAIARNCKLREKKLTFCVLKGSRQSLLGVRQYSLLPAGGALMKKETFLL